ncbi:hypothetical protein C1A50_4923 [Paenibacillus polymyxa]|nr:hypothetical protein C1A50_4923 [Paenibacillus polymyxa]
MSSSYLPLFSICFVYASNAAARSYPRKPVTNMEKATCA